MEKTKTPDFLTEAFCLTLEQILNQYLTMRCSSKYLVEEFEHGFVLFLENLNNFMFTVLDEVNGLIPDSDHQYSDPVAALKFLLTLNEVPSDVDIDSRVATESSPKIVSSIYLWYFL